MPEFGRNREIQAKTGTRLHSGIQITTERGAKAPQEEPVNNAIQ